MLWKLSTYTLSQKIAQNKLLKLLKLCRDAKAFYYQCSRNIAVIFLTTQKFLTFISDWSLLKFLEIPPSKISEYFPDKLFPLTLGTLVLVWRSGKTWISALIAYRSTWRPAGGFSSYQVKATLSNKWFGRIRTHIGKWSCLCSTFVISTTKPFLPTYSNCIYEIVFPEVLETFPRGSRNSSLRFLKLFFQVLRSSQNSYSKYMEIFTEVLRTFADALGALSWSSHNSSQEISEPFSEAQ